MEIRIVIDAPRGWLRRIVAFVLAPLGVIAAAALWARAAGVPNSFSANQVLSASQMNANFTAVTTAAIDGGVYSVGATLFVGATPAKTAGDLSGFTFGPGYVGAKKACEFSFPSRPTAHMCTGEELVRSMQLGASVATGWYSTGVGTASMLGSTCPPIDCGSYSANQAGWTNGTNAVCGSIWNAGGPTTGYCNDLFPVLCCD